MTRARQSHRLCVFASSFCPGAHSSLFEVFYTVTHIVLFSVVRAKWHMKPVDKSEQVFPSLCFLQAPAHRNPVHAQPPRDGPAGGRVPQMQQQQVRMKLLTKS